MSKNYNQMFLDNIKEIKWKSETLLGVVEQEKNKLQ